ncbi:hypothetical protein [Clostridium scatologenes]|uniref:Uncharacterized protein n=1 Tax=Clostridium scatologenes TaxID=1548 RepID=A0A0E3JY18_CLOSL|nr:hypothetical protein [Clostridium scatologenes]AKA68518.1 hypothetical protein CSCA_1393 [Clostridium scatologenes]
MIHIEVKELTDKERLELSLKYSISSKHKKSLLERINKPKEPEEKETIYINFGGIKSIQRWALMDIIKDVYTNAEVVNDEANCDYSVKFLKYGTVVDDTYFAIKTKNGDLEIYKNSTGLMIEIIKSKNLLT